MSSLLYNIKQGFLQIFRNRGMSLASIFSILAMLLYKKISVPLKKFALVG